MFGNVCTFIYVFLMLGIVITNLILSIIYFSEMSLGSQLYDYPLKNWRTDVVIDFEAKITCNSNNIFHYTWPGTMNGCRCTSGGLKQGSCCVPTQKQSCSSSGSDCRGSNINGVSARNAEVWELNNTSIQICATRLKSYNYLSKTPDGTNRCASTRDKICGSGEKGFCVPKDSKCPIRDFVISEESSALNNIYQEQILVAGSTYLYITRNSNNVNPVAQFRVGEGNNICLRNSFSMGTPTHSQYILQYQDTDSSCITDPRFKSQLDIGEKRFFYLNGIDTVINSLPYYTISDANRFQNFYNHINYLNPSCQQFLVQIFDNSILLDEIQSLSVGLLVLCCLSMAHYLFFDMWTTFVSLASHNGDNYGWGNVFCKTKITQSPSSQWECGDLVYQFFILIKYIIIICQLAVVAANNGKIEKEVQFLDDLKDRNCSDAYFYTICQTVVNSVTSNLGGVILGLTIVIILIDPSLFYAVKFILSGGLSQVCIPESNTSQPYTVNQGTNNHVNQITPVAPIGVFNQKDKDDDELLFPREPDDNPGHQQTFRQTQPSVMPITPNYPHQPQPQPQPQYYSQLNPTPFNQPQIHPYSQPQPQPYPQSYNQQNNFPNSQPQFQPQPQYQQQNQQYLPQNPSVVQPQYYMPQQYQQQQSQNPGQPYNVAPIQIQPSPYGVPNNLPPPTVNIVYIINQNNNNSDQINHIPSPDPNYAQKPGGI